MASNLFIELEENSQKQLTELIETLKQNKKTIVQDAIELYHAEKIKPKKKGGKRMKK